MSTETEAHEPQVTLPTHGAPEIRGRRVPLSVVITVGIWAVLTLAIFPLSQGTIPFQLKLFEDKGTPFLGQVLTFEGSLVLALVLIGWSIFAAWVGALLDLPGWLIRATPWGRLPHLPGGAAGSGEWTAVAVETVLALVFIAVGALGFRRRALVS